MHALAVAAAVAARAADLWRDPTQPVPARVAALLPQLSLEELVAQIRAPYGGSKSKLISEFAKTSVGTVSAISVADRNAVQAAVLNESRHGIPVAWEHESLHSGCSGGTVFPMPLTMGASFNTTLVEAMYAAIAAETRACGANIAFAPVINLWTDPRFGRHQEGFSPNPSLTAHLAVAAVAGLQGSTDGNASTYLPKGRVIALGKHYAGYGGAVGGLNGGRLAEGEREVRDVYLKPWRYFAAAGGRGAMPAHNTVLDVPCHAHDYLVNAVFREELGFGDGLTISDCNDVGALISFGVAANASDAAAKALIGGVDQDLQCGSQKTYTLENVQAALDAGLVSMDVVRRAAGHVLTMKFASGLVDDPYADEAARAALDPPEYRALAREAAEQGVVLLKNDGGALPLAAPAPPGPAEFRGCFADKGDPKLNGKYDPTRDLPVEGGYSYNMSPEMCASICAAYPAFGLQNGWECRCGAAYGRYGASAACGMACGHKGEAGTAPANRSCGGSFADAVYTHAPSASGGVALLGQLADDAAALLGTYTSAGAKVVTVKDGLAAQGAAVRYEEGASPDAPANDTAVAAAVAAAANASAVIVVVGDSTKTAGEWSDRASLDVKGGQLALLRAVVAAKGAAQRVIVVVVSGGPATFGEDDGNAVLSGVDALLWAGRPGEEGGSAIARILYGAVSPSAHLPASWPKTARHVGSGAQPFRQQVTGKWVANHRSTAEPDGRVYDSYTGGHDPAGEARPLFYFGSGLQYTTFKYSGLSVAAAGAAAAEPARVRFTVTNTGGVRGRVAVQVYVQDPKGGTVVARPWKRLAGFARVDLAPAAAEDVTVVLSAADLALHDERMRYRVQPGTWTVRVGGSAIDDTLTTTFVL